MSTSNHVLIAVDSVTPPAYFPGECQIRGRVAHVWSGMFAPGSRIEVTRSVFRVEDQAGGPPPAEGSSEWKTARDAKYIDAYLDDAGGRAALAPGSMFLASMPPGLQPKDPVMSAANVAIGSSIVGIGCAPFSILGAIFAFRSISLSRKAGRAIPGRAIVALLLAIVVFGIASLLTYFTIRYNAEKSAQSANIANRLKGKRGMASLDAPTACDLAREQIASGLFGNHVLPKSVVCHGTLVQTSTSATLPDVDVEWSDERVHVTACLGRGTRWFLAGFTAGSPCPSLAIPPQSASDEKGLEKEESAIRQSSADLFSGADIDAFGQKLRTLRDIVVKAPNAPKSCDTVDVTPFVPNQGEKKLKPAAFDVAFLDIDPASTAKDPWAYMTSSEVRDALDVKATAEDRASNIHKIWRAGGPYIVVYASSERVGPLVTKKKGILSDEYGYIPGVFKGSMFVVDTRSGAAVCQGPLTFENSASLHYKKRGMSLSTEETRVHDALMDNLEEQFKDAATNEIRTLSGGKLGLGYKLLE